MGVSPKMPLRGGGAGGARVPASPFRIDQPVTTPIAFISDVHLDHKVPERIDRFERFLLEDLPSMGSSDLYVLGDLFNIWYRDSRIEALFGARVLGILQRFVEGGGKLEYVVGNRDFALCFDRSLALPFPIHRGKIERHFGARSFFLCHGDDLCKRDWGYRALHGIIRQTLPMAAFHSLSSDSKEWIVAQLINLTHEATRRKALWKTLPYWPYVQAQVDRGVEVFIQGHIHHRECRVLAGKTRRGRHFVLPRWFDHAAGLLYDPESDRFAFFNR